MRLLGHLLLFSILLFPLLGCQPSDRGIDAVELDISNPVELLDIQLDPGGSIYYRIDIGQTTVLHAAITLEESDADILVDLLDYNENSLEQTNLSGLCRSLYTAVSPGSYYIRIYNNSTSQLAEQ